MVIWHLKQIGKVKELDEWVTHKLTTNQKKKKITVLKCCSSFIVCNNNNKPFLDQIVTCKEKWILSENDSKQLSAWTKKKLQSSSQKRSWSLFGGLLPDWSTTAFWILVKTIASEKYAQQIDEMHQKLQCLQPILVNRMGPILLHDNAWPHVIQPTLKSWMNWAMKFCLIRHIYLTSCQPTTTSSSILTTFCRENTFQMFNKSQSMDSYGTGINKIISCWQKCVDCNSSYFD